MTVSFVSSFPFSCLAVSGSLVAYFYCHFATSCDAVSGSCITYFSCWQSKDLLMLTSRAISRVLVLQLQDLLLPTLLDDAVFFALILEGFLEDFFVLFVSNCIQ